MALRFLGVNFISDDVGPANVGFTTLPVIATRALRRIAVVSADETPEAVDQALAEEKVRAVHETLAALGYITWLSGAVPERAAEQYVIMTANLLLPAFGQVADAASFAGAQDNLLLQAMSGGGAQSLAEDEIGNVHQYLNSLGLTSWNSFQIPDAVAFDYAMMASVRLAAAWRKPVSEDAYNTAIGRVRLYLMSGPTGQTLAEEKIQDVHTSLGARGMTRWTIFDVPSYATDPYVMMAAVLLAPEVGGKADPDWWADGERAIRRVIAMPTARGPVVAAYF